jgi:hypothetical protein
MRSMIVRSALASIGIMIVPFAMIYFIPLEKIDFETLVPIVSVVAVSMSLLAVVIDLRSRKPAPPRTITITIEDSAGGYARIVGRSERSVGELKRDLDQIFDPAPPSRC